MTPHAGTGRHTARSRYHTRAARALGLLSASSGASAQRTCLLVRGLLARVMRAHGKVLCTRLRHLERRLTHAAGYAAGAVDPLSGAKRALLQGLHTCDKPHPRFPGGVLGPPGEEAACALDCTPT